MSENRSQLKKGMGLKDLLALAFGSMIGWGWVMLAGTWVDQGGSIGAIIAFVIAAILTMFVGLVYAELTPMLPLAGGEFVFTYRAMGYVPGFLAGWFISFAYMGVCAWEGPALSNAISFLFGELINGATPIYSVLGSPVTVPFLVIAVGGAIIITALNYFGASKSAKFQLYATIALGIGGISFMVGGVVTGEAANLQPLFTDGAGFTSVLLAAPLMFVGFDVIPQAAEEMDIPLKGLSKAVIWAIILAAFWYTAIIFAAAIAIPGDVMAGFVNDPNAVPVANSFAYICGGNPIFAKIMIIVAILAILTSWNGFVLGATRVLFAMSRAKMIPAVFSKVHPKYGSPSTAVLLVGVVTVLSPLLGKGSLGWFVNASALGSVVAFTLVCLAFCILRKKEPELNRPFKTPGGMVTGVLAVVVSLFIFTLYLPIYSPAPLGIVEWCLIGAWLLFGIIIYIANTNVRKNTSKEETEYLIMGDQFKRF